MGKNNKKKQTESFTIFNNCNITRIIIATYNQLDYTKQCIESIRKYTKQGTYEIVVVDNNSTDDTIEWLNLQDDIIKIINNENLGFPAACNQGIKISEGNDILLLNNDTIVTENWLNNLHSCLYSKKDIGAVGPVTNYCSNLQKINAVYNSISEMHEFAQEHNKSDPLKWEQRLKLIGYCLLIKKEVVEKIGFFDEIFSPGNFEDDDYSIRIIKAGYRLFLCKDTFIHHFGSISFNKDPEKFSGLLKANTKKFESKWGFNPDFSFFKGSDMVDLMTKPKNQKINILEVGCAFGATLLKIKSIFNNAKLYGIELNKNAADIASSFAEIKTGNIENIELDYKENYFDYIILADVLDHMVDPWRILDKIGTFLKHDGEILASMPNIMHFSIIKSLINGRFQYQGAGILDKNHLRFFTLYEINEMFASCGFNKIEFRKGFLKLSEEDIEFIENLCKLSNKSFFKQFEAYQYTIKARK